MVIAGIISFLYGANCYDATIGWMGIGLFVVGILCYAALKVYETQSEKKKQPKRTEPLSISGSPDSSAV
jgi:hypothetical protein